MIRTYFGNPRSGKTTLCVKQAIKNKKRYDYSYVNFPCSHKDVITCDTAGLGEWTFPDCSYVAIDEAGIEYNSRSYKALPKPAIKWFKKHGHYKCDIDVFSQSWEDIDVTLRRLSVELWYVYRCGPWSLCRKVYKRVTIDKNTEQIIDGYRFANLLWLLIWPLQLGWPFEKKFTLTFRPFYYRYFDSYEKDDIPVKTFL